MVLLCSLHHVLTLTCDTSGKLNIDFMETNTESNQYIYRNSSMYVIVINDCNQ